MRERVFRKPSIREVLDLQEIECPSKITEKFVLYLIGKGILVPVGDSYEQAVHSVENLPEGCFALFGGGFKVPREETDYGIKSLEGLVKIDSQRNLRNFSGKAPTRLTKSFVDEKHLTPETLLYVAIGMEDVRSHPFGFYWVGTDGRARCTTWIRAIAGAEMEVMKQHGDFFGDVLDKKPYGRNLRVRVRSRTEEGRDYEFTLSRLPIFKSMRERRFSNWLNIEHNSPDPDASYRGQEHQRREYPLVFWSASTIFSFYETMRFIREHPEFGVFGVNPFPIPKKAMVDFADTLRLRSFVLDDARSRLGLSILNKSQMDLIIGAKTVSQRYSDNWFHHGERNLGYLYTPRRS